MKDKSYMITSIDVEKASDKVHYPFITPGYFFVCIPYHCFFSLTVSATLFHINTHRVCIHLRIFPLKDHSSTSILCLLPILHIIIQYYNNITYYYTYIICILLCNISNIYNSMYYNIICPNVTSIYKKVAFITCCPPLMFYFLHTTFHCCCCSVTQWCLTLCDQVDCSTSAFSIHYLPEFAQTHVRWVSDAIQPSHPLPPP